MRLGYSRLVAHLTDRYAFYSSLRALPPMRGAYDDAVVGYSQRLVRSIMPAVLPDGVDAVVAATYSAGGALALLGAWIGGALDGTDDELVDHLLAQLPAWLAPSAATTYTHEMLMKGTT